MRLENIAAKALKKMNDDRYALSLAVAKRAEQLAQGAAPLVSVDKAKIKFTDLALQEIAAGKVGLEGVIENN